MASKGPTQISFKAPTTNVDGTPVDLKEIDAYVGKLADLSDATKIALPVVAADANGVIVEPGTVLGALAPGAYFLGVKAESNSGVDSDFSNIVTFQVIDVPVIPNPPTELAVV